MQCVSLGLFSFLLLEMFDARSAAVILWLYSKKYGKELNTLKLIENTYHLLKKYVNKWGRLQL